MLDMWLDQCIFRIFMKVFVLKHRFNICNKRPFSVSYSKLPISPPESAEFSMFWDVEYDMSFWVVENGFIATTLRKHGLTDSVTREKNGYLCQNMKNFSDDYHSPSLN